LAKAARALAHGFSETVRRRIGSGMFDCPSHGFRPWGTEVVRERSLDRGRAGQRQSLVHHRTDLAGVPRTEQNAIDPQPTQIVVIDGARAFSECDDGEPLVSPADVDDLASGICTVWMIGV
jgi:hypothetical protein